MKKGIKRCDWPILKMSVDKALQRAKNHVWLGCSRPTGYHLVTSTSDWQTESDSDTGLSYSAAMQSLNYEQAKHALWLLLGDEKSFDKDGELIYKYDIPLDGSARQRVRKTLSVMAWRAADARKMREKEGK